MASTQAQPSSMPTSEKPKSEKPVSEKQRLKLEKFAIKKQKQTQQKQKQQQSSGPSKDPKSKKQDVPAVESKDWIEETPAGRRKILKPLDDDFHKAYIPRVVESA
jgi:valyl-tRNA synthetase